MRISDNTPLGGAKDRSQQDLTFCLGPCVSARGFKPELCWLWLRCCVDEQVLGVNLGVVQDAEAAARQEAAGPHNARARTARGKHTHLFLG